MRTVSDQSNASTGQSRLYSNPGHPVLVYLPGVHGDSTLFTSFRVKAINEFQIVEFIYPRTTTWSLANYAEFVLDELRRHKIGHGWLLAESYGSQVAWSILQHSNSDFCPDGIILAGGFIRYPIPALASLAKRIIELLPHPLWRTLFFLYARYAQFRHRSAPETKAAVAEFIHRRTPKDLAAMAHRLDLIAQNDPREIVRQILCPVYLLAGAIDPVVLTWLVLGWLKRHCPTFSGHRIIWPADHNVLGTEPAKALSQVLAWINKSNPSSKLCN